MADLVTSMAFMFVGAAIGTIGGYLFNAYRSSPNLRIEGAAGGAPFRVELDGTPEEMTLLRIFVRNSPRFTGIRIPLIQVDGRFRFPSFRKGYLMPVLPAENCRARLYDYESGDFISDLYWGISDNRRELTTDLPSSSGATLYTFARIVSDHPRYFTYEPDMTNGLIPKVPDPKGRFYVDKRFKIKFSYTFGEAAHDLCVSIKINGSLYQRHGTGRIPF
jgi:hypothetical protein